MTATTAAIMSWITATIAETTAALTAATSITTAQYNNGSNDGCNNVLDDKDNSNIIGSTDSHGNSPDNDNSDDNNNLPHQLLGSLLKVGYVHAFG